MATAAALLVGGCSQPPGDPGPVASTEATAASTTGSSTAHSTTVPSSPVAAPDVSRLANADDYLSPASRYPQWGFTTPASPWVCVIATYPSNGDRAACVMDRDQGPLPFPGVPFARVDADSSDRAPNAIVVYEGADAGFLSLGQPIWEQGGVIRVLPGGTVLRAGGFSCNAQGSAVSCLNDQTGKGFSVSGSSYQLVYQEVP